MHKKFMRILTIGLRLAERRSTFEEPRQLGFLALVLSAGIILIPLPNVNTKFFAVINLRNTVY